MEKILLLIRHLSQYDGKNDEINCYIAKLMSIFDGSDDDDTAVEESIDVILETPNWVIEIEEEEDAVDGDDFNPNALLKKEFTTETCCYRDLDNSVQANPKNHDCSICLTQFDQFTIVRELRCNHVFCDTCILKWFVNSDQCPQCRKVV